MTSKLPPDPPRPVVAVVHGDGSVSPMKIAASATAVCDLVWLVDSSKLEDPLMLRLIRKLGAVVDVSGMSEDEAAEALRPCRPQGLVAYADHLIPVASSLAIRLGLEFHDSVVTGRLVDKWNQRQALQDAGLPVPRFGLVPPDPTDAAIDDLATRVTFPVVLKPRRGTHSKDTLMLSDIAEFRALLADQPTLTSDPDRPMILEEYLRDLPPSESSTFANYVSVESVVTKGTVSHVAVTGRFPPAKPFRETGFLVPSALSPSQTTEVLEVASKAIEAIGMRYGMLHIEIKLTPDGPRVIEVNGRLGGGIPEMVALAAGIDLFELSLRVALGEPVVFDGLVPTDRVGYILSPQPPQWARRVVSVEGLDQLGEYPGVETITLNRQPGDDIDWRQGNFEFVFLVLGAAPDPQGVLAVQQFIDKEVRVIYA